MRLVTDQAYGIVRADRGDAFKLAANLLWWAGGRSLRDAICEPCGLGLARGRLHGTYPCRRAADVEGIPTTRAPLHRRTIGA